MADPEAQGNSLQKLYQPKLEWSRDLAEHQNRQPDQKRSTQLEGNTTGTHPNEGTSMDS